MNNKLTTTEAAAELGISEDWLRCLLRQGRIRGEKFGTTWAIDPKDIDDYEPKPVGRPPEVNKVALLADYAAGMTASEVAAKHGCTADYVYQLKIKAKEAS